LVTNRLYPNTHTEALLNVVIYNWCKSQTITAATSNVTALYFLNSGPQSLNIQKLTSTACEVDVTFQDSSLAPITFPSSFFTFTNTGTALTLGVPDTTLAGLVGVHEFKMTQTLRYTTSATDQWIVITIMENGCMIGSLSPSPRDIEVTSTNSMKKVIYTIGSPK